MDRAKELARKTSLLSDHKSHKMAAVIVKGKSVLAARPNWQFKTHPEYHRIDQLKTLHAESSAILSCRHKNDLRGSTIVVFRSTKDGRLAMSKPCEACTKLMKIYGIKKVVYTNGNEWHEEKVV